MLTPSQASVLRDLSLGDETWVASGTTMTMEPTTVLDARTIALVRLTALIVRDSTLPGYQRAVQAALDAGVTVDQVLALLRVLAQPAGSTAVVSAAPKLAMALGYDVEAGLEEMEE